MSLIDLSLLSSSPVGSFRLDKITREQIKGFIGELVAKGLKKTSIRKIGAELCAMLNRAVEDGKIQTNPAARLSKFYKNANETEEPIVPFSPDEVPTFLQAVKKHHSYYLPVFVTFLHAGVRPGELAALCWPDIDWKNRWLIVRKTVKRSGAVGRTKTGRIRKVDLSDLLIKTLQEWQQKQERKFKDQLPEWGFLNKEAPTRLDLKNLYHRPFKDSLAKAKLCHRRLHDLRHTFATLLIMQGESLAYVKDQLGHSKINQTVDTYTHWIPGSNRQAVNRLPGLQPQKSNVRQFKKVI